MTFLQPLFLAAAAAIAVPIILHLWKRRDDRPFTFPALRYLQRTSRDRARIVRLRQLLLLALRISVLALIVLAGARLVLPLGAGDHPPAGLVLVVDNGLTSGTVIGDARILDHLVDRALDALDQAGRHDRIWVLAAGAPWEAARPGDASEARARLRSLEPTHLSSDLPAALARARALLDADGSDLREILVLSDWSASAVGAPGTPLSGSIRTLFLDATIERPENRGVTRLQLGGGLPPRAGAPSELEVTVAGGGDDEGSLRLFLNGRLAGAERVGPEGRAVFQLPPFAQGWIEGRVELDPDALRADDVRHFTTRVIPPSRVALAGAIPSYVEEGVEVLHDAGRVELVAPTDLPAITLAGPGGWELPPGGRRVVLFPPEDPSLLPALNELLARGEVGWRLGPPSRDGRRAIESIHPRLPPRDALSVDLSYPLLPPDGVETGRVQARLEGGAPWLVEVSTPQGEVVLIGSPLVPDATEIPTSAAMLPLLDLLTAPMGGGAPAEGIRAGEPIRLTEGVRALQLPDGTVVPADGISSFLETGRAGVHRLLDDEGEILDQLAVNPDVDDGGHLTADEAARTLAAEGVAVSERGWSRAVLAPRRGREVWALLLAAVFLFLLAEGWLASAGTRSEDTD